MKKSDNLITKQLTVWVTINSEHADKHLFKDMALRYDYEGINLSKVKIFVHDKPKDKARKWKIDVAKLATSDDGVVFQTILNDALEVLNTITKLENHRSVGLPWSNNPKHKDSYGKITFGICRDLLLACNHIASQNSPYYSTDEKLDRLTLDERAGEFSLDEIEDIKVKRSEYTHTIFEFQPGKKVIDYHMNEMQKKTQSMQESIDGEVNKNHKTQESKDKISGKPEVKVMMEALKYAEGILFYLCKMSSGAPKHEIPKFLTDIEFNYDEFRKLVKNADALWMTFESDKIKLQSILQNTVDKIGSIIYDPVLPVKNKYLEIYSITESNEIAGVKYALMGFQNSAQYNIMLMTDKLNKEV